MEISIGKSNESNGPFKLVLIMIKNLFRSWLKMKQLQNSLAIQSQFLQISQRLLVSSVV